MRLLIAALLTVTGPPSDADRILIADVAVSEFTPALLLTLDLESGQYTVAVPAQWPTEFVKPKPRGGTLTGAELEAIRTAYAAAEVSGLGKPGCTPASLPMHERLPVLWPVPHLTIVHGARRLTAPGYEPCFTKQAVALQRLVDGL